MGILDLGVIMHVRTLTLENFQGFAGKQEVECAPITLLFGPNASGKSSIFRSLKMLKQTFAESESLKNGGFVFSGPSINLKSRSYVSFSQREETRLGAGLGIKLDGPLHERFGLIEAGVSMTEGPESNSFSFSFTPALPEHENRAGEFELFIKIKRAGGGTAASSFELDVTNLELLEEHFRACEPKEEMSDLFTFRSIKQVLTFLDFEGKRWSVDEWATVWECEDGRTAELLALPDDLERARLERVSEIRKNEREECVEASFPWKDIWDSLETGDLVIRATPHSRADPSTSKKPHDALKLNIETTNDGHSLHTGATIRIAFLNHLINFAFNASKDFLEGVAFTNSVRPIIPEVSETGWSPQAEEINDWMSVLTNYRYSIEFEDNVAFDRVWTQTSVRDSFTGASVSFENVGSGLSQLFPILELLASGAEVVLIEQPELHLHPKMQSDFVDILIDAIDSHQGLSQIFVETHSESILLRLQKRIRDGVLSADDVRIIYCEPMVQKLYDEESLIALGNDLNELKISFEEHFSAFARLENKNNPLSLPWTREKLMSVAKVLGSNIKVGLDPIGGNTMSNIQLDQVGDVLDPFPISFADLRLSDLL